MGGQVGRPAVRRRGVGTMTDFGSKQHVTYHVTGAGNAEVDGLYTGWATEAEFKSTNGRFLLCAGANGWSIEEVVADCEGAANKVLYSHAAVAPQRQCDAKVPPRNSWTPTAMAQGPAPQVLSDVGYGRGD